MSILGLVAPTHLNEYELLGSRNVCDHLEVCVEQIDHLFGAGYAQAHPSLVEAMITACVADVRLHVESIDHGHDRECVCGREDVDEYGAHEPEDDGWVD